MARHDVIISYSNGSRETHYNITAERATELEAAANADPGVGWVTVTETDPDPSQSGGVFGIVNNYYGEARPVPTAPPVERRTGIADREYPLTANRPSAERIEGGFEGAWTMWQDGRQTYVLQWGDGAASQVHGWQVADWTDTVIMAIEALRLDRDKLDRSLVRSALTDVRRLRSALAAVEDGLLMAARTKDPATGRELLSWRELADAMGVHHSTIGTRHGRLMAGERPDWWTWLAQNVAPMVGESE